MEGRGALLSIAKVHSITVLSILFLGLIIQMTEVAALSIEDVPTGTMAIASSLHVISDSGSRIYEVLSIMLIDCTLCVYCLHLSKEHISWIA